MNWTAFLLKRLGVFCLVYYSLIIICEVPAVEQSIHSVLAPRLESFAQQQFPKAYLRIDRKNESGAYNELWIRYENNNTVAALQAEMARTGRRKVTFYPRAFAILIQPLFVFPLALLLGLILATPQSWRGRLAAIGTAGAILALYCTMNVWLKLWFKFQVDPVGVYELSKNWSSFVREIVPRLTPGVSITFVILVWILVCFRTEHLQLLKPAPKVKRRSAPQRKRSLA